MADRFDVGDVIRMKKPHPCGSCEWEVLRVGADFRLKCQGCGHQIMVARRLVIDNHICTVGAQLNKCCKILQKFRRGEILKRLKRRPC